MNRISSFRMFESIPHGSPKSRGTNIEPQMDLLDKVEELLLYYFEKWDIVSDDKNYDVGCYSIEKNISTNYFKHANFPDNKSGHLISIVAKRDKISEDFDLDLSKFIIRARGEGINIENPTKDDDPRYTIVFYYIPIITGSYKTSIK